MGNTLILMKNIKAKSILSVKKYKKIVKIINKYNFNKFELITNYGLFCGDNNLFKTLTVYEIIQKIKIHLLTNFFIIYLYLFIFKRINCFFLALVF